MRDGVFKMGRRWFAYSYGMLIDSFGRKRDALACYNNFNAAWDEAA